MPFDVAIFQLLNGLAGTSPASDEVILFFANYLAYVLIAFLIILVLFSKYSKAEKIRILVIPLIAGFIARGGVEVIRWFYHRPRPFVSFDIKPLIPEDSYSFPSGHASFFFAMAMTVYLFNKKWGTWFFIAAILMGVARVMAGVHYISDIVAGLILGVIVGYFVYRLSRRFKLI